MYGVGLVVELVHGLPCWNLTGDISRLLFKAALEAALSKKTDE
jgi:hypothetical protein